MKCKARFNDLDAYHNGDCYDITLLVNMDTTKFTENPPKWEIRTTDLTIFIPKGKQLNTADLNGYTYPSMWIYPRQKNWFLSGRGKNGISGVRTLPNYFDYNIYLWTDPNTVMTTAGTWSTIRKKAKSPILQKERLTLRNSTNSLTIKVIQ